MLETTSNCTKLNEQQISDLLGELQYDLLPYGFIKSCTTQQTKDYPIDIIKVCQSFLGRPPQPIISITDQQLNIKQPQNNVSMNINQLNVTWISENTESITKCNILFRYHLNDELKEFPSADIDNIGDIKVIIMDVTSDGDKTSKLKLLNIDSTYNEYPVINSSLNELKYIDFLSNQQKLLLVNGYVSRYCMKIGVNLGFDVLKTFQIYFNNFNDSLDITAEAAKLINICFTDNYDYNKLNVKQLFKPHQTKQKLQDNKINKSDKSHTNKPDDTEANPTKDFKIGDRVKVGRQRFGVIKFIGESEFAKGEVIGLILDKWSPVGHNGTIKGKTYFQAPEGRGYFTRRNNIHPIEKLSDISLKNKPDIKQEIHNDERYEEASFVDKINKQYHGGNTVLHIAAQRGDDNLVQILIKYGIDPDIRNENGETALLNAAQRGHVSIVETLLSYYAGVNLSSSDNQSPLMEACLRGYHEIVKLLLSAPNIKINQKRRTDGATALYIACEQGAVECVKALLTNDLLFVNGSTVNGKSPLYIASFYGYIEIIELLLNHSSKKKRQRFNHGVVDVNQCTSKGYTALLVAARNGHQKIVGLLLQNNADVNQAEQTGITPLSIASRKGHSEIVRILFSNPDLDTEYKDLSGITALWAASANNHSEIVELLLHPRTVVVTDTTQIDESKRKLSLTTGQLFGFFDDIDGIFDDDTCSGGSDLSDLCDDDAISRRKCSRKKQTATSKQQNKQKQQHARIRGANPNLAKHDGCTSLWIAASRGYSECMKALINYGADLNKPDRAHGATPVFMACQNGKKSAVDMLLSANCDVNRPRSGDGLSPLMIAAYKGHAGIVGNLLKSGADPIWANTTGLNALNFAAMQGHIKVVELIHHHLLNTKNAQEIVDFVNAGDGLNGWTSLHLACMGGHENVIKYLVNTVKVDVHKKDYENKIGSEHALQNGYQNIASWLSQQEHQ